MRPAWMDAAACRGSAVDHWFVEVGATRGAAAAKRICQTCPVRFECLELAITENIKFGVFGGLTPKERRPLVKVRRQARNVA